MLSAESRDLAMSGLPSAPRNMSRVAAAGAVSAPTARDRKSTRLNSSHTVIYTLSLHDALPIYAERRVARPGDVGLAVGAEKHVARGRRRRGLGADGKRSEEHTSELQSHSDLHSFPTRRSSDLC